MQYLSLFDGVPKETIERLNATRQRVELPGGSMLEYITFKKRGPLDTLAHEYDQIIVVYNGGFRVGPPGEEKTLRKDDSSLIRAGIQHAGYVEEDGTEILNIVLPLT